MNLKFFESMVHYSFQKLFFGWLILLIPVISTAQIDTKIDTAHIKIGEPIHYTLSVLMKNNSKIQLPELTDTISSHIEILDQQTDTIADGNEQKLIRKMTITSYDPGEFLIRSLPVIINSDTLLSHSFQIQVDDVAIDSANLAGYPIKPIMDETYNWKDYLRKYWLEGLIVLLMIAVLAVVWWWMKNREKRIAKKLNPKTPYEEAKEALKKLDEKKYLDKHQIKPYYSDLSFLLRRYLGRVFNFSSLELLSDDLVEHLNQTQQISKDEVGKLKEFLFDSDLVKYAKAIPEESRHQLYRRWVEDLIEKTKPVEIEDETQQTNSKTNER